MVKIAHLAAVGCLLALAGCQTPATSAPTQHPTATTSIVVTDRGLDATGMVANLPKGPCHIRWTADGQPLPDPECTPGATDRAVSQETLSTTLCRKGGYTGSVRMPNQARYAAKVAVFKAYGISTDRMKDYELDHLVELGAGGSNDGRNLWPEPNILKRAKASAYVYNDKDEVEGLVHDALCRRTNPIDLRRAQSAMATDWTTAEVALGLS